MKTILALPVFAALGYCSSMTSSGSDRPRTKRYDYDSSCTAESCRLKDTYDFIVIGGGTAGCVVASRLTEIPGLSVLMIEAGGDEAFESRIPYFFNDLEKSRFDWNYTSTQQKNMCLSKGGICDLPRGYALGGSSSINHAIYTTGSYRDFDGWEALGNPTWSWKSVLPYFQKAEHYLPCDRDGGSLGRYGPLAISEIEPYWLTPYIIGALQNDIGLPEVHLNDGFEFTTGGYETTKVTIYEGERMSTNRAYILPVLNRHNLDVITHSLVTKIIISGKVATGIEFIHKGVTYRVSARKEVILSAGVIGSPQILMLSGVGPADHLSQLGIPVIQNLPGVGYNLQDHPGIITTFRMTGVDDETSDDVMNWLEQYLLNRTGPITFPQRGLALVAIATNSSFTTLKDPDIIYGAGKTEQNVFAITGCVSRAESRGRVYLRSSSPTEKPYVDPNYLSSPRDFEYMRQLAYFMFQLANTPTMAKLGVSAATYISDNQPDCANSNDLYSCLARNYGFSQNHLVGTCKMGPARDPQAVVNWELKVYGIDRLRIVDGSIIPVIPGATLEAPIVMIAEKASDMIKSSCQC